MQKNAVDYVCVLVAVASCLLVFSGCGGSMTTVQGKVTFEGQPVESGTIVFEAADRAGATAGGKIEQGTYQFIGPKTISPGDKIVRITAVRKTGRQIDSGPPFPAGTMVDELERYIPAIYNRSSTLRAKVVAGETNQHDFELHSQ